jgi:hypothetical protein
MKKGQTEVIGLLIIVIILSLVILFVLKTVFTNKSTDTTQSYEESKIVESFVNTLFQTSSGCTEDTTIKDLLIDCAKNPFSDGIITCSNEQKSCQYANETIGYILENSIQQWGLFTYEFIAVAPPNQNIIHYTSGDISASMGGETTPFILPLGLSGKNLYVYLCLGGCGI